MDPILAAAKFSKPSHRKAAEDFVEKYKKSGESEYPYLGHWVGMATHDVGSHDGPLKPGMVFTIEPALTVPDEKIYVRLEDIVFITEKGAEVVSTEAPWDIDAIEKVMKEEGMLERYKRVTRQPGTLVITEAGFLLGAWRQARRDPVFPRPLGAGVRVRAAFFRLDDDRLRRRGHLGLRLPRLPVDRAADLDPLGAAAHRVDRQRQVRGHLKSFMSV